MPFGKRSRSVSRARSMDSVSSLAPDEYLPDQQDLPEPEQEKIKLQQKNMELKMLMKKSDTKNTVEKTIAHPLGKYWIQMTNKYNNSLNEDEQEIQLQDICEAFQKSITLDQQDLQQKIQESTKNLKKDLYKKSLSFHLINPLIQAPTNFSPTPTLLTVSKAIDALKMFPQNKSRFSGIKGDGPPIAEFMYAINAAQERLNLSEDEFKQKLLSSCTGPAHKTLRTHISEGDDVPALYHQLLSQYDNTVHPTKAKAELSKFKIGKRSNLFQAQTRILELSGAAARIFKDAKIRKTVTNIEACQCLIRALPKTSSTLVATQYNLFLAEQEDDHLEPLFVDFIRYLDTYQSDIDMDIKINGASFDDRDERVRDYKPNPPQFKPYRGLKVQATHAVYEPQGQANMPQRKRAPYQNVSVKALHQAPIQNKFLNRMYCSLCGKTNHTSAQGCYAIKKNGVVIPCAPTQIPCHICEKVTNKKLYHPPTLCFNKNTQRADSQNAGRTNQYRKY